MLYRATVLKFIIISYKIFYLWSIFSKINLGYQNESRNNIRS